MDFNVILGYLKEYWGIIAVVIMFGGFYIVDPKKSIEIAKDKAKDLIIEAKVKSEEYALATGKDKFAWVSENGYKMLPVSVKLFISKSLFEIIIQYVFDNVIDWAKDNKAISIIDSNNVEQVKADNIDITVNQTK